MNSVFLNREPSKCARRLTVDRVSEPEPEEEPEPVAQVQKQISEGPVQVAEIVLAETHEELAEPQVGREEEPEDDEVQPMEIEEPAEPPSREFGVSKTFNQESPDVTALEPEQDAQQDPTRIYGRVSSILSLQASGEVVDDLDESALSLPPPPPPATETKQIYGRVSGLRESQELVETPKAPVPPARFGRVAALRNIDHAASRRQI
uniref:Uncharacterized protein n=1 Tax=Caenorhabditis japonica TaxID=281687 RepID=A0A8R1IA59_CAEJA